MKNMKNRKMLIIFLTLITIILSSNLLTATAYPNDNCMIGDKLLFCYPDGMGYTCCYQEIYLCGSYTYYGNKYCRVEL